MLFLIILFSFHHGKKLSNEDKSGTAFNLRSHWIEFLVHFIFSWLVVNEMYPQTSTVQYATVCLGTSGLEIAVSGVRKDFLLGCVNSYYTTSVLKLTLHVSFLFSLGWVAYGYLYNNLVMKVKLEVSEPKVLQGASMLTSTAGH